ncbi:phage holin family protein [Candidatus Viridilinea mediisalina]|uniref:Phage holin family protein n=1 Tax=Candidatus Viridilinea mediisalina TaxID=2024553 RepID=A0A2A6RGV7_9CHLR|nr:phage holin family protein [Candidatus Viridilinea mediisalina]PDW02119.1 hypothetical protein CJ255_15665 [Candidatus Viridilinea mediisalina]
MLNLFITWIVTALSLILITRLNIGITVDNFGIALVAAIVIGLVNAILGSVLHFLAFPLTFITLGLFALLINGFLFWVTAKLVVGFHLRDGYWSALIGSILLSIINAIFFWLLGVNS